MSTLSCGQETAAQKFGNRVALVTGAGSGIGEATAHALAEHGATIVVADRDLAAVQSVSEHLDAKGVQTLAVQCNVASLDDVRRTVAAATQHFGSLDLAVNNAGFGGPKALLADVEPADWHRVIDVNLTGTFYSMQAEIPAMLASGGGAIVNISSILGLFGSGDSVAYTAAKHGVTGLTKAAALGYANQNIRVNSVHPGYTDTPALSHLSDDQRGRLVAKQPIGRLGTAADVANVVMFLLSDEAAFVTGAQYSVDGAFGAQ